MPGKHSRKSLILTLVRPSAEAFASIQMANGLVNHVELALDFSVPDEADRQRLHDIIEQHLVKSHHGKHKIVRFKSGEVTHGSEADCTYFGQRRCGLSFVVYSDKKSKVTNLPAVHLEARVHGSAAVKRFSIKHVSDLIEFDQSQFWQKHLRLLKVDTEILGRLHSNREQGRRRKTVAVKTYISGVEYNADRRRGSILFRSHARHSLDEVFCTQLFVDRFGRGSFLKEFSLGEAIGQPAGTSYCLYTRETQEKHHLDLPKQLPLQTSQNEGLASEILYGGKD